ncbi:hypothetical protein [Clavibacter michiganensis]|uniref:hypothetical protein n=1 Tax=Clavibacter michiganensis TaxID=28447 RepID=UPI003DA0DC07
MNFDDVRTTVDDVLAAMWRTHPYEHLFVRDGWPAASCESVAVAVAVVLEDRGLGQWTMVTAGRPGEANGHAWLELRDVDGTALFSIDPTLHQFPELSSGPFVGEGCTPAVYEFTDVRSEGSVWDWKWLGDETQIPRRLIRAVRAQLAGAGDDGTD